MIGYVARRLGWALFVVWVVVSGIFVLMNAIGDPAAAVLGAKASPERIAELRRHYGLDRPLHEQYLSYLGLIPCTRRSSPAWNEDPRHRGRCGLLQGDFGESFVHKEPVSRLIGYRFPRTLLLGSVSMFFELLFGLTLGVVAAIRRNTWFDTGFMALAFLGISAPSFLTGLLFLHFVAYRLGWFPVGGYGLTPWEHLYHALLPAFTLAIIGAATYARIMRSEMVETLRADYVRTARAKGAGEARVVMRHAFRNALLPIVTIMGLSLPLLVSGAIITESIYAWPGMGSLLLESIYNLDVPTVMAVVVVVSSTVQLGNLLADVAVAALDPRVRLGARAA